MRYRNLETRGLRVSAVGLGCMGMSHAYGAPADRREMTGLVAFSPLANGLLSDRYTPASCFDAETDYRATMPQFRPESYERNRELLELIRRIAEDKNATPAQISLAWMLCKKPWIVPIPGTRKADRLKENAEATDVMLTDEEVEAIDRALDVMPMSDVFGGTFVEIIQSDNKVAATFLRLCPELGETLTVEPMFSMGRNGQHIRMEWVTLTVAFFRT